MQPRREFDFYRYVAIYAVLGLIVAAIVHFALGPK